MRETVYVKPNIGSLKGKVGRSIIETIRNTPKPDRTQLYQEVEEIKARIIAARKNEE